MRNENQELVIIHRDQYCAPAYWIDSVHLTFDLDPQKTRVLNKMMVRRNPEIPAQSLVLNGEELNLARVLVNGKGTTFKLENDLLILSNLPEGKEAFELEIFTTCAPDKNTQLSGLYTNEGVFMTQCEAEGFRRITYFLDRPDVMAMYTVILRADKVRYPVLLSNGNLMEEGDLESNRHYAVWHDPFRKPSYLFALVAGNLVSREQTIVSRNGKKHLLQVYVNPNDLDKTDYAMKSLVDSIVWDEAKFGLSLDLDRYMIVATSAFNMGAMENKGLNIFNSHYALANPAIATDIDYHNVKRVIGHEYFHNWTGNRVTCRDWFQLSLKEGLTVFREQEFCQDMCESESARAVVRLDEVKTLRKAQFSEDSGPMAHSVRPESYSAIDNFYTATVYEKGAEVVRMMKTLVGWTGFLKGMKLYFERFDGKAVTCDDFANSIADANPDSVLNQNLEQFKIWYSQAGTPIVSVIDSYDKDSETYTLTFTQCCPDTPGQSGKKPFVIPIEMGLIDSISGDELTLTRADGSKTPSMALLTQEETIISFNHVANCPIPSLLRSFSAPIILDYNYTQEQLIALLKDDKNFFVRWDAGQQLALQVLLDAVKSESGAVQLSDTYVAALRSVIRHPGLDCAYKAVTLALPTESYVSDQLSECDPQKIHAVHQAMRLQIAKVLHEDWLWAYETNAEQGGYRLDNEASGKRALCALALQNACLVSAKNDDPVWPGKALQQVKSANNMTDRVAALLALQTSNHSLVNRALEVFFKQYQDEDLALDKWFSFQAIKPDVNGDVLPQVEALCLHPKFQIGNPNRVRSLIFSYVNNQAAFHRADGAGYEFWANWVMQIDAINAQVASRLARVLERWKKLSPVYRGHALNAIKKVAEKEDLSSETREIITRTLAS